MPTTRSHHAVRLSRSATLLAAAVLTGGLVPAAMGQVYVDSATGSDANPGTLNLPLATIDTAVGLAAQVGCPVYVAGGSYGGFALASGVRVHGGFNAGAGWVRDGSVTTQVSAPNFTVTGNGVIDAMLDQLTIGTPDSGVPGETMYAVYLNNASGIIISNCVITPGQGGAGAPGVAGTQGISGGSGAPGQTGCEDGGTFCSSCSRPQGGNGGSSPVGSPGGKGGTAGLGSQSGFSGSPGAGGGGIGGSGTGPGNGPNCPSPSFWGQDGTDGAPGSNGPGGQSFGSVVAGLYQPAAGVSGSAAGHGTGGGGGGGGGGGTDSCDSYGTGGGGGGGGAQGGGAGTEGLGGGGSFAVFAINTSDLTLLSASLIADNGGDGGDGGPGGLGGIGGNGFQINNGCGAPYGGSGEQDDASMGGRGGDGGSGGLGGYGGGGGGGPSVALYADTGIVGVSNVILQPGSPGLEGFGANAGADGLAVSAIATTEPILITEDCNENGTHDAVDIADGLLLDANCDGIPDSCEEVCVYGADVNGDGILDNGDIISFIDAFISGCK